jgi:hypothetical protein
MRYENKLFIDGLDAMVEYGVFVERNGYRQLIQQPVFKKIDQTEWPEFDGVEADVAAPMLDARQFQIQFCIKNVRWAEDLFLALSDGVYHEFDFKEVDIKVNLRLVSNGAFSSYIRLGKMTLTFADDFPSGLKGEPYELGESEVVQRGYTIDDIDFSQFGMYVLKGTDDSIRKAPNVRENLKITAKNMSGASYDSNGDVHWRAKDMTLKLFVRAADLEEFWERYGALYQVLMSPGLHTFNFSPIDVDYHCFYKSNSVSRFEILTSGKVWCEFSVVMTVTDWHPVSSWLLLETEGEELVITEGNINYTITIRI